jgi:hypothetical protein
MNENDTIEEIDLELEEGTVEETATDSKPKESNEARIARLERQLSQAKKKAGIEVETKKEKVEEKKDGLDRIDRAVLRAEKITSADEIELIESIKKETGKDVESILESRYFQSELKALREEKTSQDAMPSKTKRNSQSSTSSVDYWLAKGEMPPASEPKLRTEYVNAKIAKEKAVSQFSSVSVIG